MTDVNPYLNTEGRTLTIYTQNGSTWSQSSLPNGSSATLPPDQRARNIWDSAALTVKSYSNIEYNGSSNSPAWILPSSSNAGGLDAVNVIIINNSNINHVTANGIVITAGQTRSATLSLGVLTLGRLFTTQMSTMTNGSTSTDRSNPFQILPLPDQIVTINSSGIITVSSNILTRIPTTELSIHNCYSSTLWIRIRASTGAIAQNLGQIMPNQTLRLLVYSNYQIFLESGNSQTMSGVFTVPTSSMSSTVFFMTNGMISTSGCSGTPIPPGPSPGPTPPPVPPLPPVGNVFQVSWNTSRFPANGTGVCIGDTSTTASSSVVSITPIRVGDAVRFLSTDGQTHDLVQSSSSWVAMTNPTYSFPSSTSFDQTIQFTTAGCFYFISRPQSTRMRLRVSIVNTNGSGGCTTACPGRPDQPIQPVTPATPTDQSFLERWWWAILIGVILVILIIALIIWAVWPSSQTTTVRTTSTQPMTPISGTQTVTGTQQISQPSTQQVVRTGLPTSVINQPGIPQTAYGITGSGLVPNPGTSFVGGSTPPGI